MRPARPSLADGWIHPGDIKDSKVRIFVSQSHEDHYDPIILAWKRIIPDIVYYFGWKASDDSAHHYLVGAEAELATGGLEIATINSHHSGVPEVAWLVKVDGLVVYHDGDCQPDDPASAHDFLRKKTGHIDIAFVFPVYEDGQKYTKDVIIYPDHVDGGSWREEGHSVAPSDLSEVLESFPAALVIGQGSPGRMEVPDDTRRKVEAGGTELIVQPTAGAVATYNSLRKIRRVAAALHLTC